MELRYGRPEIERVVAAPPSMGVDALVVDDEVVVVAADDAVVAVEESMVVARPTRQDRRQRERLPAWRAHSPHRW